MQINPAQNMVDLMSARAQGTATIAVVKQRHEMERQLIDAVRAPSRPAPPPPNQGNHVDKTA